MSESEDLETGTNLYQWVWEEPEYQYVNVAGGPGNRMSPRAVIRGGVLTFTAVDAADEGEYTCKALNTHGEHTARVSIFVRSMCCVRMCVNIQSIRWEDNWLHTGG